MRRRTDPDVLLAIDDCHTRGYTPAQIERALSARPELAARVPTVRTIQRIVAERRVSASNSWRLVPVEPDPQIVLRVLGVSLMDGWAIAITEAEAGWITAIALAAPDMPPLLVRRAARLYMLESEQDADTLALDRLLAVAPWRGRAQEAFAHSLGLPSAAVVALGRSAAAAVSE
jgi:hypothetical protein